MSYIPHEKLSIHWGDADESFFVSLPWMSMEIEVEDTDKEWLKDATEHLQTNTYNQNVQRFLQKLQRYPLFYVKPRKLAEFTEKDLQPCLTLESDLDFSTPSHFMSSFGCESQEELKKDLSPAWRWDKEEILDKARIFGTRLYDPISLISYLICHRLDWESTSWWGQTGFAQFLERLLKADEVHFFQGVGWISKQSWAMRKQFYQAMKPALTSFHKAQETIEEFMAEEVNHCKFMETVFRDLNLEKDDFSIAAETKWVLAAFERVAVISPLAFSAMVNLFEPAYYEGHDPLSRVIKLSSKPHAALGYDLQYQANQNHHHHNMPVRLASYLAPQTQPHVFLTLHLFEMTLNFLECMEKNFANTFNIG